MPVRQATLGAEGVQPRSSGVTAVSLWDDSTYRVIKDYLLQLFYLVLTEIHLWRPTSIATATKTLSLIISRERLLSINTVRVMMRR